MNLTHILNHKSLILSFTTPKTDTMLRLVRPKSVTDWLLI